MIVQHLFGMVSQDALKRHHNSSSQHLDCAYLGCIVRAIQRTSTDAPQKNFGGILRNY